MAGELPVGFSLDKPQQASQLPDGFIIDGEQSTFAQSEVNPDSFFGSLIGGSASNIASTLSEQAGTSVGGLTALVDVLNPFTDNNPDALIKSIQDKFKIPRNLAGEEVLKKITQFIEPAAPLIKAVSDFKKTAGQQGLDLTGSPAFATFVQMIPDIITQAGGAAQTIKSLNSADNLPTFSDGTRQVAKQSPTKMAIIEKIKSGSTDKDLAKLSVREILPSETSTTKAGIFEKLQQKFIGVDPRLVKDDLASDAIKQGFDAGVIQPVKQASRADKNKMLRMVNSMQQGKNNALFAQKNRPSDIAGESLVERVEYIVNINREAGRSLDREARKLKGKAVDFDPVVSNFLNELDDIGIKINKDLTPNFMGSDIEGVPGAERIINQIFKRMGNTKTPDAFDIHRFKKFIDENVTYGKQADGLSGKMEGLLKGFRREMDGLLDNKFPKYDEVNTRYSETISVLDELQSSTGKKLDLQGASASKALGTELRKVMSNYRSRIDLLDSLDSVEGVYKKYGGTADDDILTQVLFVDELNSVFGTPARTSLEGTVARGTRQGIQAATSQGGFVGAATELAAEAAEASRGINNKNAFKAIRKLLQEQK
jgi:hypothetical protein